MAQDLIQANSRTALLLIRMRVEVGSAMPLRIHIRTTSDVSRGFERSSTFADIDEALDTIRAWFVDVHDSTNDNGATRGAKP